jgi:hypothetical protein
MEKPILKVRLKKPIYFGAEPKQKLAKEIKLFPSFEAIH